MAKLMWVFCVLAIWAAVAVHGGAPTSGAPAPGVDCDSVMLQMADCVTYVSNGSTVSKPSKDCCTNFKSAVKTSPKCLCEAFKNSDNFGIVLNMTRALQLPAACGVSTPPMSNCDGAAAPGHAPGRFPIPSPSVRITPSPSTSTPGGPVAPATPGGSAEARAPAPSQSGAMIVSTSFMVVFVSLAVAACSNY